MPIEKFNSLFFFYISLKNTLRKSLSKHKTALKNKQQFHNIAKNSSTGLP